MLLAKDNKRSTCWLRYNKFFTLIELLVVIAIINILFCLLLPALNKARKTSQGIACLSNQKQLYIAEQNYAGDFNYWPTYAANFGGSGSAWADLLIYSKELPKNTSVICCPSFFPYKPKRNAAHGNYANVYGIVYATSLLNAQSGSYNVGGSNMRLDYLIPNKINKPSKCPLFADTVCDSTNTYNDPTVRFSQYYTFERTNIHSGVHARHSRKANFAWLDGHAARTTHKEFKDNTNAVTGRPAWTAFNMFFGEDSPVAVQQ